MWLCFNAGTFSLYNLLFEALFYYEKKKIWTPENSSVNKLTNMRIETFSKAENGCNVEKKIMLVDFMYMIAQW